MYYSVIVTQLINTKNEFWTVWKTYYSKNAKLINYRSLEFIQIGAIFMKLTRQEKAKVILCCKSNLISDWDYDGNAEFPNEWFKNLFSFLGDEKLQDHLGDEFFQTRFTYTLMQTLSLPMNKNKGIVKFQIVQYASICEALLNFTITKYFIDEFENRYAATKYVERTNALSAKTKMTYDGRDIILCTTKIEKASVTWTPNPTKAAFSLEKNILSQDTCDKYCALYDLRNNAHILKAANADYFPKISESKDAYSLTFKFIEEIKAYFNLYPIG